MTVQKLISQYEEKIVFLDKGISQIRDMIREARKGETQSDVEDLTYEKVNAQRNRQIYFQFIKDLKTL